MSRQSNQKFYRPKSDVILGNFSALKLTPGDILVVHYNGKLTPELRRKAEQECVRQLWGKKNSFFVIDGDSRIGVIAAPEFTNGDGI